MSYGNYIGANAIPELIRKANRVARIVDQAASEADRGPVGEPEGRAP
jgi:hypothetical protein